ncbi:MAG: AAA family ATPase, partial [Lachnospiraceae bacterium]|nr:AAA family ATPase [Lachnospiraceae bacterium]
KPTYAMNPIVLKPNSTVGSEVIVNGKSIGNMKAAYYFAYKTKLIPDIKRAFENLENEYDAIVIEGAGSPAEINLKQNDIVNMGIAEMFDAPVLLVADINPGGVFAQIYGTVMLLEESERVRIKGIIINKFRGDRSILTPGIVQIEQLTGIPVLGVMPYLDIDIEEEDSLSERKKHKKVMLDGEEYTSDEEPDSESPYNRKEYREKQFDTLEKAIRENLDISKIRKIMNRS